MAELLDLLIQAAWWLGFLVAIIAGVIKVVTLGALLYIKG